MTAKKTAVPFSQSPIIKGQKQLKPFVKWAGGKGQLLTEIRSRYPQSLGSGIVKYAEPFVGGGAVLFDILSCFDLQELYIGDINAELINTYKIVRDNVDELIELLLRYQDKYLPMEHEDRKIFFYNKRKRYNELISSSEKSKNIESASLFIFLNRTCFNGLYRVNRRGCFNVPIGSYKNPVICDTENLCSVSLALKKVKIVHGDYREAKEFIDDKTLAYFDPPYRPLTRTSSFTAYTQAEFSDGSQKELAGFVKALDEKGAKILVSNSDPKNTDIGDNFFDNLYGQFSIERVKASRAINSKSSARGKINELLICNY